MPFIQFFPLPENRQSLPGKSHYRPGGTDVKIWRVELGGADRDIFLQGIPPFLTNDPTRLLVLP